jgi:tRNA A-37 threonylcarbamoyl transferase component Bud32
VKVNDDNILPPRYEHPERIARGGMGEIYRAQDSHLARTVAVKVLSERYADNEATRGRFTREGLAAARLSKAPSTITIFDVGEHEGRPYIVMEYLAGGSLADRLTQGAQPLGRALDWLGQTAAALDAAHASGVVHRDVKPANLLLDDDDRVKVADFGVASAADLASFTEAGTVVGTAGYLAPEQARGETATSASDRYALAVVAFELLTGVRPFERESSTSEAMAHVSAPIPPASAHNAELPHEIDDVLARGLAKQPEHRYASCADFVQALRDALEQAAGTTSVAAVTPVGPHGRSRLPVIVAALAALVLAGGLAAALLTRDDEAPTARDTIKETVTLQGTTVVETVTTAAQPTTEPATTTEPAANTTEPPTESPAELNDRGFALMRAGDYEGALPLLEQAVAGLAGSGETAEAYASYNLALTRLALGRCDGVLELLDRSKQVQGDRKEISRLRREAERGCRGADKGDG